MGVSALYVYQHAPEVQEARPAGEPARGAPAGSDAGRAGRSDCRGRRRIVPTGPGGGVPADERGGGAGSEASPDSARRVASRAIPSEPAPSLQRENVAPSTAPGTTASATASAPVPESPPPLQSKAAAQADAKKETLDERRDDAAAATPPAGTLRKPAQSAESSPSRDAAGSRAAPAPAPPAIAAAPPPEARGRVGGSGSAAPAAPAERGAEPFSMGKSRAAAKLMRASDASGRLAVSAPEAAEIALDALLSRLGGTRVARRLEGPHGLILVDVIVSAARYPELLEGLGKIGRWTTEHEPKTLPPQVRVEVAVTVEP